MVSSAFSTSAVAAIMAFAFSESAIGQTEEYPPPFHAQVAEGVPQGKVEGPFEFRSNVFPGTVREYWVYVPAKYNSAKPPALMIVTGRPWTRQQLVIADSSGKPDSFRRNPDPAGYLCESRQRRSIKRERSAPFQSQF